VTLSTHILDTAIGVPAIGVLVVLYRVGDEEATEIARASTDDDGRIASPFGGDLAAGLYELGFDAGAYFGNTGTSTFYTEIPVRFVIDDIDAHYHVPLLLSPYSYSTYRGS
jgi:5-hydroxyisourate hydrolase